MLTVFNRKELVITTDMNRQADIRCLLSENGIEYTVRTTNLQSRSAVGSRRAYTGSFGIDQDHSYEYKIYVRKDDYDRAKRLIR